MKRIEARDETGEVMTYWTMDQLDEAKRMVALSAAAWTLGIAEFESDAEADKARLDWIQENGFNAAADASRRYLDRPGSDIRITLDFARNAPKPTFTRLTP